jgi:hypothetical protein
MRRYDRMHSRFGGDQRAISSFVAVLLLIVLAIAAGTIIYAYLMGYLGGLGTGTTPGEMSLDTAKVVNATHARAYVRNNGKGTLNVNSAYVDGSSVSISGGSSLAEGSVATIYVYSSPAIYTMGNTYEIKLVASDNTQLSFRVKYS